jgi:hypothetical protein
MVTQYTVSHSIGGDISQSGVTERRVKGGKTPEIKKNRGWRKLRKE